MAGAFAWGRFTPAPKLNGPVKTKNLKPIAYEQYQRQVRVHIVPSLGQVKLRNLSPELVQELYASKIAAGLKPASVSYIHVTLLNALEHAQKRRLIPVNVASKLLKLVRRLALPTSISPGPPCLRRSLVQADIL